jgi:hypothetical protein
VTLPYDKFAALVLLPEAVVGQISDPGLRKWLERGDLNQREEPQECLQGVLAQLQQEYATEGLAALRMWGQTGDRPTVWIAAADPVYLEPRLDHLCLHALPHDSLSAGDLGALFDFLQEKLAGHERYGFARIGAYGYVRASKPMPTSTLPASVIDHELPNEYMPVDVSGSYHSLRGEVEMALHEHEVNQQRQVEGLPPVNSLWIWGGGFAPEKETLPQPPLFADEPILRGHWLSKSGVVAPWPGSIKACLEAAVAGFVAQPSPVAADLAESCLQELLQALKSERLSQVTLLLGDRTVLVLERAHTWKFWRRSNDLFARMA